MWRGAAEDGVRLEGSIPPSSSPGKRVLVLRRPVGPVAVVTPWNWPYTMPAEIVGPALAAGNTVVWTPAPSTAYCSALLAECIAEADLPPGRLQLRDRTGAGRRRRARRASRRGRGRLHRLDRDRPADRAAGRRQAAAARDGWQRAACRYGGRGPQGRRRVRQWSAASCAPARAAQPASGSSCTSACARSSSRCWPRRSPRARNSVTRCSRRLCSGR